jgi:hypothetical protein
VTVVIVTGSNSDSRIVTVVIVTVVIVKVVIELIGTLIIVTVVIVTVVIVAVVIVTVMKIVIVTSLSKNNLTHWQPMRCSKGSVLQFSRCFYPHSEKKNPPAPLYKKLKKFECDKILKLKL